MEQCQGKRKHQIDLICDLNSKKAREDNHSPQSPLPNRHFFLLANRRVTRMRRKAFFPLTKDSRVEELMRLQSHSPTPPPLYSAPDCWMHQLTPGSCPKADGIQKSTSLPPWGKKQDSGRDERTGFGYCWCCMYATISSCNVQSRLVNPCVIAKMSSCFPLGWKEKRLFETPPNNETENISCERHCG